MSDLLVAAKQVVERWDSPDWKDQKHTAGYIHELRQAIAQAEQQDKKPNECANGCLPLQVCDYCQKAEQEEPEVWYCPHCGTLSEERAKCCPDWIRARKVTKNFALTCKATFDRQEQQEPVAWMCDGEVYEVQQYCWRTKLPFPNQTPLYTAPPQREWVEPSDEQISECGDFAGVFTLVDLQFARAVLKLAKELNNGAA